MRTTLFVGSRFLRLGFSFGRFFVSLWPTRRGWRGGVGVRLRF